MGKVKYYPSIFSGILITAGYLGKCIISSHKNQCFLLEKKFNIR